MKSAGVSYQEKIPLNIRDHPEHKVPEYVVVKNLKFYL